VVAHLIFHKPDVPANVPTIPRASRAESVMKVLPRRPSNPYNGCRVRSGAMTGLGTTGRMPTGARIETHWSVDKREGDSIPPRGFGVGES